MAIGGAIRGAAGALGKAGKAYADSMEQSMTGEGKKDTGSGSASKSMSGGASKIGRKIGSLIKGKKFKVSKGGGNKLRRGSKSVDL